MLGLETAHSTNAQDIHTITWVLIALAAIFVIAVNAGLLVYLMRFRASRGRPVARFRGRARAHARAAAAFTVVGLVLFVVGVVFNEKVTETAAAGDTAANPPVDIHVVGQQWIWRYEYPTQQNSNGAENSLDAANSLSPVTVGPTFNDVFSYYELIVPVDTQINLDLDSTDVVHRWWVPALGAKFEAIPGHTAHFSFNADETGDYEGASTAFSGGGYAAMRTRVRVVSRDEYDAFITQQAADIKAAQTHVQQQLASGGPPGITPEEVATEGTGQ